MEYLAAYNREAVRISTKGEGAMAHSTPASRNCARVRRATTSKSKRRIATEKMADLVAG